MEVDDLARDPGGRPQGDHKYTHPAIGLHGPLVARGLSDREPARVAHHGPADPDPEGPDQAPRRRGAWAAGDSRALRPEGAGRTVEEFQYDVGPARPQL